MSALLSETERMEETRMSGLRLWFFEDRLWAAAEVTGSGGVQGRRLTAVSARRVQGQRGPADLQNGPAAPTRHRRRQVLLGDEVQRAGPQTGEAADGTLGTTPQEQGAEVQPAESRNHFQ